MATATDTVGNFGVDFDFDTAGNYTAGVPTAGQVLLLDNANASKGIDGEVTVRIDASALKSFRVGEAWKGHIGDVTTPLAFDCDEDLRFAAGTEEGQVSHFQVDVVDAFIDHKGIHANACILDNRTVATGNIWHTRGNLQVVGAFDFLRSHPVVGGGGGAFLEITAAAAIANLEAIQSRIKNSSGLTTCKIGAGTKLEHLAGTVVTTEMWDNCEFVMKGGAMTTVFARGGLLDLSQSFTDKTITNLYVWAGATVNLNNASGTNSVTNLHIVSGSPTIHQNTGTKIGV